jgi:hypothetical protein
MTKRGPKRRARVRKMIEHIQFEGSTYSVHDEQGPRPLERIGADPRFLKRIEKARKSLRAGRGVRLEDL